MKFKWFWPFLKKLVLINLYRQTAAPNELAGLNLQKEVQPMPHKYQNIQTLFQQVISAGHAMALYKLPGSEVCCMLTGKVSEVSRFPAGKDGFIIFPFNTQKEGFFLAADKKYEFQVGNLCAPELNFYQSAGKDLRFADEGAYCHMVNKALEAINHSHLQKVVLSRAKEIELAPGFNVVRFFSVLAKNYGNAFVYLFSAPQTGTWLGASPELLIEKKTDNIRTMALAGTIRNNGIKAAENTFTDKEQNEQQLVTDYILDILKKYSDEITVSGPEIKAAGNISHLITNFKALLKPAETGYFTGFIKSLHPTPAVCGIPKEKALDFILENEGYDRTFYSGYLGPVTKTGDADFFVNLRCMQLLEKTAVLYAGAGIVKGSDPQKEWQETAHKMNTLLQYLPQK